MKIHFNTGIHINYSEALASLVGDTIFYTQHPDRWIAISFFLFGRGFCLARIAHDPTRIAASTGRYMP